MIILIFLDYDKNIRYNSRRNFKINCKISLFIGRNICPFFIPAVVKSRPLPNSNVLFTLFFSTIPIEPSSVT